MSANTIIAQAYLRHAIDLEKFKAAERNKALKLLKTLEQDLVVDLVRADVTAANRTRLTALLQQVRATIQSSYTDFRTDFESDLMQLAQLEGEFAAKAMNTGIGAQIFTVEWSAKTLKAIVGDAHIQGGPLREWWDRQAALAQQRVMDTIRLGVLRGDDTGTITSTLRTELFQGTLRRNTEALVRTSVASISNDARLQLFDENSDVVQFVQQHSTLDARTTPICMAYSGKLWKLPNYEPVGHDLPFNNGVPRHWGCRSTIVPSFPAFGVLAGGKSKQAEADKMFRSRLRDMDVPEPQIAAQIRNAQASMDGVVPESWDYEEWLSNQSKARQLDILGPGKYKLWQAGKLKLTDLVDQSGDPLTLEELKQNVA